MNCLCCMQRGDCIMAQNKSLEKISRKCLVNSGLVSNFASFFGLEVHSDANNLLNDRTVGVRQVCVITNIIKGLKV